MYALLAIALLCISAQEVAPNTPPSAAAKSSSTISELKSQKKANEGEKASPDTTKESPCNQCFTCPPIEQIKGKTKEEQAKADSLDLLYRRYMWATIIGVVGGLIGVGILIWQTFLAGRAANAARDNAIAARLAAQSAINAERPYIEGDVVSAKYNQVGNDVVSDILYGAVPEGWDLTIRVSNRGRTPAKLESVKFTFDTKYTDIRTGSPSINDTKPLNTLLPTTDKPENLETFDLAAALHPEEWKAIWRSKKTGILQILIRYSDLLSEQPTKAHETSFLYEVHGAHLERDASYNQYS